MRDLAWVGVRAYLCFKAAKVRCKKCGCVRAEAIDWLAPNPRYTRRFAYQVARLCLATPIQAAAAYAELSSGATSPIMEAVAGLEAPFDISPKNLRYLGIDEKSWRKGRRFVTIVTDLERGGVIWLGKGRGKETIDGFFKWLGEEACSKIETCVMDLAQAYERSARIRCRRAVCFVCSRPANLIGDRTVFGSSL